MKMRLQNVFIKLSAKTMTHIYISTKKESQLLSVNHA